MENQDQREIAAGTLAAVSAAATVMFVVLPRVHGALRYVLGLAGVLTLVGAALLFVSQWQ